MKPAPKLFVAPFNKSFNAELRWWHGYIRHLAGSQPWGKVIVASNSGREFLYRDFADEVITADSKLGATDYSPWRIDPEIDTQIHPPLHSEWPEFREKVSTTENEIFLQQRFSQIHSDCDSPIHADILILANSNKDRDSSKQASNRWKRIAGALSMHGRVASIGNKRCHLHISDTIDARGLSRAELATLMCHARVLISPENSYSFLAGLCKLPTVILDNAKKIKAAHDTINPLLSPLKLIKSATINGSRPTLKPIIQRTVDFYYLDDFTPPFRSVIIGMKRSGHHAILKWLAEQAPHSVIHGNNCHVKRNNSSALERFAPNLLQNGSVEHIGTGEQPFEYWPSFENRPLESIANLNANAIDRAFVVTRDLYNLVASCRVGIPPFKNRDFDHPVFSRLLDIYRSYLRESLGLTNQISAKEKIPISYNLWHTDLYYRKHIIKGISYTFTDAKFGQISHFGGGSSFLPNSETDATKLDTLNRWKVFENDAKYKALVSDPELIELTEEFHQFRSPFS